MRHLLEGGVNKRAAFKRGNTVLEISYYTLKVISSAETRINNSSNHHFEARVPKATNRQKTSSVEDSTLKEHNFL